MKDCIYREPFEAAHLVYCRLAEEVCGGEHLVNPLSTCCRCSAERRGREPDLVDPPPAVQQLCGRTPESRLVASPMLTMLLAVQKAKKRQHACLHRGEQQGDGKCKPCSRKYECELPQVHGLVRPRVECQICEFYEADTPGIPE